MATPLPITFASLPTGLNALQLFDQQFAASVDGAYFVDASVPASALVNSGATAGTYGSASAVSRITVNAKGLLTSASAVTISIATAAINDLASGVGAFLTGGTLPIANGGTGATAANSARLALSTPTYVATITALKALDTTKDFVAVLTQSGRAGTFLWTAGNFTSQVAADTLDGIYVKANAIAASAGAWVRVVGFAASPKWWGAAGDNSTDDAAPLQLAVASAYPLNVDALYRTSATLTYSGSTSKLIFGSGDGTSRITTTNSTDDILVKNGTGSLTVQGVGFSTTVDKSAGAAIRLTGGGTGDLVDNCTIAGLDGTHALFHGVSNESDIAVTIRSCIIKSCKNSGVRLAQVANGRGDNIVLGCTFDTAVSSPTTAAAVRWTSGEGSLRVTSCSLKNYGYGILYVPVDGEDTASLIATGNQFENNITYSIQVTLSASGTALMQSVSVIGNGFYNPTAGGCVGTAGSTNTDWIDSVSIIGNAFTFNVNYPVNIGAANTLQEDSNTYTAKSGSLTAILTGAAVPLVGELRSPLSAFVNVATPWLINANPNIITPATPAPVTKTADFTVAANEVNLINNKSGSTCTVTLPAAASYAGRSLTIKTIQAQTVVSATSNVVPLAGGAAGTAILAGTAGKWATLVSNGTNWIIMAAA